MARQAHRLALPTLLVRGALSDLVTPAEAEEFLRLVPHATYVDVAGAAHMIAGDRNDVAPLARAAVAAGVDALFVEVHPDPEDAPCDGQCQLRIDELDLLLTDLCAIADVMARPAAERA